MKILLDIKDNKASFFMELLKNFNFVRTEPINDKISGKAKKGLSQADKEYEKEHKEMLDSSSILLGMKYDEDEPDISNMPIKEYNPTFNIND